MASGGKRGASERVLESKHVIGLFLLMLLFSGVFFTLGYVMGRNQYDAQVRTAVSAASRPEPVFTPKADPTSKKPVQEPPPASGFDPATSGPGPDWEFSRTSQPAKSEPRLDPVPKTSMAPSPAKPASAKGKVQPASVSASVKSSKGVTNAPPIPTGAYVLQVAALLRQDDALGIASSLQKKHYAAFVQTPQKDKYYRVQVGPFKDQKSADAAKKGLESEGFKAFYVKH
jgi:septal ring-binding cell division protein DamX